MFLYDAEMEVLTMTHAMAGAYFANAWRLPKSVVEPIRYHHQPSLAKAAPVHMADIFVKAYNVGFSGDTFVPAVHRSAWELFDFSEAQMKELFSEIGEVIAQVDDFFTNSRLSLR
jgi:hypothetical protein